MKKLALIAILLVSLTTIVTAQSNDPGYASVEAQRNAFLGGSNTTVSSAMLISNPTFRDGATVATNLAVGGTLTVTGASALTGAVTARATISANTISATGLVTFAKAPILNAAVSAAPTGAVTVAFPVTINGTNYLVEAKLN